MVQDQAPQDLLLPATQSNRPTLPHVWPPVIREGMSMDKYPKGLKKIPRGGKTLPAPFHTMETHRNGRPWDHLGRAQRWKQEGIVPGAHWTPKEENTAGILANEYKQRGHARTVFGKPQGTPPTNPGILKPEGLLGKW